MEKSGYYNMNKWKCKQPAVRETVSKQGFYFKIKGGLKMKDIQQYDESIFESTKQMNEYGEEFWYARDLKEILKYDSFAEFESVIEKAKIACANSGYQPNEHFYRTTKKVQLKEGIYEEQEDVMLSRYACYLIVINADPHKEVVALGQTYFAVQARQKQLREKFEELDENRKRLLIREELKEHNKRLSRAAKKAGVESGADFALFQNHGYQGLYGGLSAKDIKKRKGIDKNEQILDYMGSTELAANLFRATQTEEKLRRDEIKSKEEANKTHYNVGKKVRQTIQDIGGIMPEHLSTPKKSIQQIEREEKKKQSILKDSKKKKGIEE